MPFVQAFRNWKAGRRYRKECPLLSEAISLADVLTYAIKGNDNGMQRCLYVADHRSRIIFVAPHMIPAAVREMHRAHKIWKEGLCR